MIAPVSCASTTSTNCIFQCGGTICGVKNAIIVAATYARPARSLSTSTSSCRPCPRRRAVSRARCIDRPASVATPSSHPVAIASAITPNASAFSVRAATTVITSVTALPAASATPLRAIRADSTRLHYVSRKQFHVRKASRSRAAANGEFTPTRRPRMHRLCRALELHFDSHPWPKPSLSLCLACR